MSERIYVGVKEICDITLQLSKGFRELGFDVTNVVVDQSDTDILPYGSEGYRPHDRYIDHEFSRARHISMTKELVTQARKHDVFIFNWASSFFGHLVHSPRMRRLAYADLPILKRLGKKVGVIGVGSDLRSYDLLSKELDAAGLVSHRDYLTQFNNKYNPINDENNAVKAKKIQRYADAVFARPDYAQFLNDYNLFTIPIDPEELEYRNNHREAPKIIHAPTSTGIKGTKYVLEAVEDLRSEGYDFEFELVQDLPNTEFRKKLTESDIVIDQLLLPGHGLLAVEAMATGNAVLTSAVPEFNRHPEELPALTTTPDNIRDNLRYLLENKSEMDSLIKRSRPYIEEYHHYKKVSMNILDELNVSYS
jgi:glycosyltransferase involved in cell wall biosynthesis